MKRVVKDYQAQFGADSDNDSDDGKGGGDIAQLARLIVGKRQTYESVNLTQKLSEAGMAGFFPMEVWPAQSG